MVAKTKTRTITKFVKAKVSRRKGGLLEGANIRRLVVKAGLGVAAGLAGNLIANKIRPDFADEAGIITASLAGGAPGTILWTLLGKRLSAALQGAFTPGGIATPGTTVGL